MANLWIAVQLIIGFNLVFPFLLLLIAALKRPENSTAHSSATDRDFAIIVTVYGQTVYLREVLDAILALNYAQYHVYVVMDNCKPGDFHYHHEQLSLLYPEAVLGGNVKSHFYAIDRFVRAHDCMVIVDSDNLVDKELLTQLNVYFDRGYQAVQGLREAKNLDSMYACLDAARDIYYHYYDGKLLFQAGSSATLSGSGMAFDVQLYKDCLGNRDVQGAGFDKVLQYELLSRKKRIAFAPLAIVFDEKTSASDQLVNQRARWINTWFKYFKYGFTLIGQGIRNFSWNQILFGLVLLRPPLFLFLILSLLFMVLNLWIWPAFSLLWMAAFFLFVFSFGIALLNSHADKKIYKSLLGIPKFMFFQVKSLIYSRNANKRSVATVHGNLKTGEEEKKN